MTEDEVASMSTDTTGMQAQQGRAAQHSFAALCNHGLLWDWRAGAAQSVTVSSARQLVPVCACTRACREYSQKSRFYVAFLCVQAAT